MTFTIEQLEALKEGITPGPWKFREHSDYEYPAGPEWGPMQTELEHAVLDAEDAHLFGAYNNYKMIEHPGNLPLAAASPELLDQLIAAEKELQQLKEMAEGEHAFEAVTRLAIVGNSSRILEAWGVSGVAMSLQDDGRTLKIFYREENQ